MLRFQCPSCGTTIKAKAAAAGKTAKCPKCKTALRIPSAKKTSSTVPAPKQPTPANTTKLSPGLVQGNSLADSSDALAGFDDLPAFESLPGTPPARQDSALPGEDPFGDVPFDSDPLADPLATGSMPSVASESNESSAPSEPIDLAAVLESTDHLVQAAHQQQLKRNSLARGAKLTKAQIVAAFKKPIEPIERTKGYGTSLVRVATTMIVAPTAFVTLVVLGTIGLPIFFVVWRSGQEEGHIMNPLVLLPLMLCAFVLLAAWIPVITLVGGALSVLFGGQPKRPGTRSLTREQQPVLYEFVDQICQKLDAPSPTRINLDCEYNASASFDSGWMNFSKQNYVLTLGVPLIATQSAPQLASVIAHEFGHFCQTGGMRAGYLIRYLNGWFMHAAYRKAVRDETADYVIANSDVGGFGILWVIYYWIGLLGRQLMLWFGMAGHAISGVLSREMEYDADRYAVHLAGSKGFAESMRAVEKNAVAYEVTMANLQMLFEYGVLVDNIPRFMMHISKTMPAETVRKIAERSEKEKQKAFDTHPPTRDRIAAANDLGQSGVVNIPVAAKDLVDRWSDLCQQITLDFYTGVLQQPITSETVTPLEDVLATEHKLLLDKE